MSRFAFALIGLLVACHVGLSVGVVDDFDPRFHQGAPPSDTPATGTEEKLAGLDVYVSGSHHAKAAVVLVSDIYGWEAPLFRKLADKIAHNGYYVVAPDFFFGDPVTDTTNRSAWFLIHPQTGSVEPTKNVVTALKAKGFKSVGLAGFCWGGKVAILTVNKYPNVVNAIVQLHPGGVVEKDYVTIVTPIMILASPTDNVANVTGVLRMRKQEKVKVFVKIFKDVVHGWTVRYNESDPKQVYRANRAHGLLLDWYHKYLHVKAH